MKFCSHILGYIQYCSIPEQASIVIHVRSYQESLRAHSLVHYFYLLFINDLPNKINSSIRLLYTRKCLWHVIFTDFTVERATVKFKFVKFYYQAYLACKHVCEIWKFQWLDTLIHEI